MQSSKKRARRDKKAFLSEPCKEIEENNRMGQTRDLLKNIGDTKGTFHAKMGTKKDRNGMDLTEAEDIKEEVARIHRRIHRIHTVTVVMMQITMMVWSLT